MLQITVEKGTINIYPNENAWRLPLGFTGSDLVNLKKKLKGYVIPKSGIIDFDAKNKPFCTDKLNGTEYLIKG